MAAAAVGWPQVVFHAAVVAYYAYVDHVITAGVEKAHLVLGKDADDPELLRWQSGIPYYFTFWNLTLQKLYFTCCCIDDILEFLPTYGGPIQLQRTTQSARKIIFASILFPATLLVAVNFWGVALMEPSLVFVDFLHAVPSWVNHACHTFVLPIVLLEMYLRATTEEQWGKGSYKTFFVLYAFNAAYGVTGSMSVILRGCWPYPFLDQMSRGGLILFHIYIYVSSTLWLSLQNHLINDVWGKRNQDGGTVLRKKEKL